MNAKSQKVFDMVKRMKQDGVPIDGVGLQIWAVVMAAALSSTVSHVAAMSDSKRQRSEGRRAVFASSRADCATGTAAALTRCSRSLR